MAKPNQPITTKEVNDLLRTKFNNTEYAYLEEVRDSAGFHASRSCDAVTIGLWPSRGNFITGYEVKISRTDWLKEYKSPEKAEAIFQYCDFFYLVAGSEEIFKIEEVPLTWGIYVVRGKRLILIREAPKLSPKPVAPTFLGAMFKRATKNMIHLSSVQDKIDLARETGKETGKNNNLYELEQGRKQIAKLTERIKNFETATGMNLDDNRWCGYLYGSDKEKKIADAVNLILQGGPDRFEERLQSLENTAQTILSQIQEAMKIFPPKPKNTNG